MRAVNYFIKRFEYAAKKNGTIKLNQYDVDALNQIIEFYNTGYKNTELEDSLLLFYILQNWKVENRNNETILLEKKPDEGNIMGIRDSISLLQKICMLINPKKHLYNWIAHELWAHQAYNKVPKEKWITEKEVEILLERELHIAKNHFSFAKEIDKGNAVYTYLNDETKKLEPDIKISELKGNIVVISEINRADFYIQWEKERALFKRLTEIISQECEYKDKEFIKDFIGKKTFSKIGI